MSTTTLNYEIARLQSIANIFDGYVMFVPFILGTVGNLLNIFVFIYLKELRCMPNSIFLVSSFIGSQVLLCASRFPRSILALANIDLLAISAIYCKLRWLLGRWVVLALFSILTWNNLRFSRLVRRNRFQEQVNQMMLAEFVIVLITTIATFVYNIYSQATQSVIKSELRLAQEDLWSTISAVINFTMHTGPFYVYVIVSRAYRQNVRTAICLKKRHCIQPQHIPIQHEQIVHLPGTRTTH
ncbi:unnamed protein product [Rotaria sp. Silwood1]|nr:unnamed protein product [Rotaria sp. Silwood1]